VPWHPAITLFAFFDVLLLVGIVVAALLRQRAAATRWRRRRSVRTLLESPDAACRLDTALIVRRPHWVTRLLVRELGRRANTRWGRRRPELPVAGHPERVADRLSGDHLPRLLALLESRNERLVLEALVVVGRGSSTYAGALVSLAQLVRDGSPRIRFVASWACLRVLRTCPDVLDMLQSDASPDVRSIVVRAAGYRHRHVAVMPAAMESVVRSAINDPEPSVRQSAVEALLRCGSGPTARAALIKALGDPVQEVRIAAAHAFSTMHAALPAHRICRALSRADPQTGDALLIALWTAEGSIREDMAPIAMDPHAPDRIAAIRLLGGACGRRAQAVLATLLDDPDQHVRLESAAASAWAARASHPRPLESVLVDRLLASLAREVAPVLVHAIDALAYCGDARAPAALMKHIPRCSGSLRERLVEAVAKFDQLAEWSDRAIRVQ